MLKAMVRLKSRRAEIQRMEARNETLRSYLKQLELLPEEAVPAYAYLFKYA